MHVVFILHSCHYKIYIVYALQGYVHVYNDNSFLFYIHTLKKGFRGGMCAIRNFTMV